MGRLKGHQALQTSRHFKKSGSNYLLGSNCLLQDIADRKIHGEYKMAS